jgi:hypothetical protein
MTLGLQSEQPQLYENITKNLTPEEQQVIQAAANQADALALLAQQQPPTNGHISPALS